MLLQLGSDGRPGTCGGEVKGDDEDLEWTPASFLGGKAGAAEKSSSHSKPPPEGIFGESRWSEMQRCSDSKWSESGALASPSSSVELSELVKRFK